MIPEHLYSYYYWLDCVEFTPTEFSKMVEAIQKAVPIIDGVDEEDHSLCLRFNMKKPKHSGEINLCKQFNRKIGRKFLSNFQKSLGGRLYFNIAHNKIKWNN